MASPMAGQSGADDVVIENAVTVGDFQVILNRAFEFMHDMRAEKEKEAQNYEQQLAQLSVEIRMTAVTAAQAQPAGRDREDRYELVDVKAMSPAVFNGFKTEHFKAWAKKVKAFTNAKFDGYRKALEASETMPKDQVVDASVIGSWRWDAAVKADSKLHDMLMLVTAGEAQGIVETVPGRGFEAWRLLNLRYNSVGEMYTYDKMNSIMHQTAAKSISQMPAAIAKFEKDLKVFHERTGEAFPEVLKLPILIQMIPSSWKKEFETQLRGRCRQDL